MNRPVLVNCFLTLFLALVAFCNLEGQNEILTDSIKQVPIPVNVVDIIEEIREVNNDLKIIKRKAEPSSQVKQIDSLYRGYKEFLLTQERVTRSFLSTNPNIQKIDNRIKKWTAYKTKLDDWENSLNSFNSRNSDLIDDLNHKIETWNLTYKNAVENKAPTELLAYVDAIRDSLYTVNKGILSLTSKYLRLQTKIARVRELVEESQDELQKFKRSEKYGIFYQRHRPIWSREDQVYETNDDGKAALESYESAFTDFYVYVTSKPDIVIKYLIYVLIIVFAVRYFRRAFTKHPLAEKDARLKRFENLLTKQGSLIVTFTALIMMRFFLLGNERIFVDTLIVLVMLTIIPMIKPYEPKFFGSFFYFLTAIYVLDALKTYAWFSSLEYRLYLFFELFLMSALIMRYTMPLLSKKKKRDTKRFSKYLQILRPYILSILLLAILANIFGYTNFTDLVLLATIQSAVVSVMAYAILLIIDSAVISVIYRHYQVSLNPNVNEQREVEKKALHVVRVLVVFLWAFLFLKIIDKLEDFYEYMEVLFSTEYTIGQISFTLGAIVSFFLVLFISYALSKIISFLINDGNGALKVFKLSKGAPMAISVVLRYLIIGFGFIFAISILGVDLSTFNLMAGALGLGIGFGLQTIISNFVSGLILIFERPILPGDSVEVNNLWGTVNRIGVRASVINTYDGAEVIVPNNNLITNDLINWTLSSKIRRMEIKIGTAYGSNPNQVMDILREAAKAHPAVLKDPEPLPLFQGFGDSSLDFTLWFWVYFENGLGSKSAISIDIYNRLDEANIEIPFPQRDVHIKSLSKGGDKPNKGIGFKNE
jgi:small-conductance mechanosensitive channel